MLDNGSCLRHVCSYVCLHYLLMFVVQLAVVIDSGVSQSYVSRFLKGDVYEMSERSRRAIQKWYIMYRKNPAAIGKDSRYLSWSDPACVSPMFCVGQAT